MNTAEQFLVYCRMTCMGGSEKGKCPCRGPLNCEVQGHHQYEDYRKKAVTRMVQHLRNIFNPELDVPPTG